MDNLGDLLPSRKFTQPPEIKIIKKFVRDKFDEEVGVEAKPNAIVINAPNAALAGTLRMHLHELSEICQTDKRLVVKIG